MLPFKLLFRDINKNEMLNEDKELIKSKYLLHFGRIIITVKLIQLKMSDWH